MKLLFAQSHTKAFPFNSTINKGLAPVFGLWFLGGLRLWGFISH